MADEDTDKTQTEEEVVEGTSEAPVEESQEAATDEAPQEDASPAAEEAVEEPAKEEPAQEAVKEDKPRPEADQPVAEKKVVKPVSASLEKISAALDNPTLSRIIEQIEKLSVLELADLVHALEDRFGVTAAPTSVGVAAAGAGSADAGEATEEKSTFDVILASAGANKIGAIKAVRELVPTLGLKEAKDLVEAAPKAVLEGVNKETAEEAKQKLTAAGATVELK